MAKTRATTTGGPAEQEVRVNMLPRESPDGKSVGVEGTAGAVIEYLRRNYAGRLDATIRVVMLNGGSPRPRKAPPAAEQTPPTPGPTGGATDEGQRPLV